MVVLSVTNANRTCSFARSHLYSCYFNFTWVRFAFQVSSSGAVPKPILDFLVELTGPDKYLPQNFFYRSEECNIT